MDRFFAFLKAVEKLASITTGFLAFPAFIYFTLVTGARVTHYIETGAPTSAGSAARFALVAIFFAFYAVTCNRK